MRYTFKAYERLKREQHIDTLFRTGKAFSVFPLKLLYLVVPRGKEELSPVRMGVSVPKKKFRNAAGRNRIKRLCRESWRLHKHILYEQVPTDKQVHLFIIYSDTQLSSMEVVDQSIEKSVARLAAIVKDHE